MHWRGREVAASAPAAVARTPHFPPIRLSRGSRRQGTPLRRARRECPTSRIPQLVGSRFPIISETLKGLGHGLMLSMCEARARILGRAEPGEAIEVTLAEAL